MKEHNIQRLREAVESVMGSPIRTPKDFDYLSELIGDKEGQQISPTTLKRLWGYLPGSSLPRISTLNLLADFVGYDSWEAFCNNNEEKNPSQPIEKSTIQTSKRKKKAVFNILLLLAVFALVLLPVIFIIKPFGHQSDQSSQEQYILKMGQHFDAPDDYLKLFGIITNDSLWGKAVPHHERMFIWTPEYHNGHWHNDGDSALMMPTITEHWEPEEYQADPELIATRIKISIGTIFVSMNFVSHS